MIYHIIPQDFGSGNIPPADKKLIAFSKRIMYNKKSYG